MGYNLILVIITYIKRLGAHNIGRDVKSEPTFTIGENIAWFRLYEKYSN